MFEVKYKALSIKQPWAWLTCAGYKDIENRNWKIGRNPRHGQYSSHDIANFTINLPERIYVHASKKPDSIDNEVRGFIADNLEYEQWQRYVAIQDFTYGAIIGEVDIIDCVTESKSPWFVGKYGFVLANPILYENPIACKGKLGFFIPELTEVSVFRLGLLGQ